MIINKKILSMVVSLVLVTFPFDSNAALKKDNVDDPKTSYNPNEDKGDIILPMPNGMNMVLRAVPVQCKNYLDDKKITLGMKNFHENRGLYEKNYTSHISSSILFEDLPKNWQTKIDPSLSKNFCYYFIGKYELTNAQWDSVMNEKSEGKPNLPKTNISWYDIQSFLRKYNEWLMSKHLDPNVYPLIDGSPMFFRLPTEAEWEYAAKGGNISAEEAVMNDYDDYANKKNIRNYAVFDSNQGTPKGIGSLSPNRLNIYDTSGNVEEIVSDGFKFVVPDMVNGILTTRLHGSEGGLITKGGSYLSGDEYAVMPGIRNELKMFTGTSKDGFQPFKASYVGARLVLSSINFQSLNKTAKLEQNEKDLLSSAQLKSKTHQDQIKTNSGDESENYESGKVIVSSNGNLSNEIDKLYNAAKTPFMKNNLKVLLNLSNDFSVALEKERESNLINALRTDAYKANFISDALYRFFDASSGLSLRYHTIEFYQQEKQYDKKTKAKMESQVKEQIELIENKYESLTIAVALYLMAVDEASVYPNELLKEKVAMLEKEHQDVSKNFHKVFRNNIKTFYDHVTLVQKKGKNVLTFDKVMADLGLYDNRSVEKAVREYTKKKSYTQKFIMETFPYGE